MGLTLHAINLGIITLIFFAVGMFKPQWPLFFMQKPSRWLITSITTVLFMVTMTMYGEGIRQEKMLKKRKEPVSQTAVPVPTPAPVPVPVPAKEAPKNK